MLGTGFHVYGNFYVVVREGSMDEGTRLAFRALILGLRNSGQMGSSALAVVLDELRYAARDARETLHEYDADQLDRLAGELRHPRDGLTVWPTQSRPARPRDGHR